MEAYVADGSQPLHTTIHYNGWVGANPKGYATHGGIHAEFETAYVSRNIATTDFANLVHAPEHIADPFGSYMQYLRTSNKLVEKVYELDKAGGFRAAGSREAFDFTAQRLAAGSQMLGACLSNQKLPASYTAYCGSLLYAPQYVTRKPITRTRS